MPGQTLLILTEFFLPGILNQFSSMTKGVSGFLSFTPKLYATNDSILNSARGATETALRGLVSPALEHLGLMSPEQLKFNEQDSVALVW